MTRFTAILCFIAVASIASAATVDKRATGGYVQNTSGSASFTMYSGCNAPGARPISNILTSKPLTSAYDSLWNIRIRIHRRDKPAGVRRPPGAGCRRRLRALLCAHRNRRPIFAELRWAIPLYCGQGDGSVPRARQRRVVWTDAEQSH